MHTFFEILQLIGTLLGFFILMIVCCLLQSSMMTEQEQKDYADFFDEFLYGERFR